MSLNWDVASSSPHKRAADCPQGHRHRSRQRAQPLPDLKPPAHGLRDCLPVLATITNHCATHWANFSSTTQPFITSRKIRWLSDSVIAAISRFAAHGNVQERLEREFAQSNHHRAQRSLSHYSRRRQAIESIAPQISQSSDIEMIEEPIIKAMIITSDIPWRHSALCQDKPASRKISNISHQTRACSLTNYAQTKSFSTFTIASNPFPVATLHSIHLQGTRIRFVKLDVLVGGEPSTAAMITHRETSYERGR